MISQIGSPTQGQTAFGSNDFGSTNLWSNDISSNNIGSNDIGSNDEWSKRDKGLNNKRSKWKKNILCMAMLRQFLGRAVGLGQK